ncbi:hypothetical protein PAXRUDRAFT_832081 [Paxillus rubicundulus Ve08.2h10]|uniref:Uncharacterized protein n=1 Tax=Paxillus rubicundulus Ve08.2h10 TaxID=930991 RepID=A0A0D0DMF9_9AGAM|nr:hypothetical protein PAXRUDRAFT_832081 [Paxillus rubicundulus Ve08.2h10]
MIRPQCRTRSSVSTQTRSVNISPQFNGCERSRFLDQNAHARRVEVQAMSDHAFKARHLTHPFSGTPPIHQLPVTQVTPMLLLFPTHH